MFIVIKLFFFSSKSYYQHGLYSKLANSIARIETMKKLNSLSNIKKFSDHILLETDILNHILEEHISKLRPQANQRIGFLPGNKLKTETVWPQANPLLINIILVIKPPSSKGEDTFVKKKLK